MNEPLNDDRVGIEISVPEGTPPVSIRVMRGGRVVLVFEESAQAEESGSQPAVTSGDDLEHRDRSFFRAGYCAAYRDGGNDHTEERRAYIGRLADKAWQALPGFVPPAPAEARAVQLTGSAYNSAKPRRSK